MRIGHNQFKGHRGGERCQTNREIIAHRIIQMLERKDYYHDHKYLRLTARRRGCTSCGDETSKAFQGRQLIGCCH